MKINRWQLRNDNGDVLESEDYISVKQAKALLKEKGGYAWSEQYKGGDFIGMQSITLSNNSKVRKSQDASRKDVGQRMVVEASEPEKVIIERELTNGEVQQITLTPEPIRLTKTALNKMIKWSSSRYESWKKKEVVNHILKSMNDGHSYCSEYVNGEWKKVPTYNDYFHSGSYCESGSLTRHGTYYIDYKARVLIDCSDNHSGEITKVHKSYKFTEK